MQISRSRSVLCSVEISAAEDGPRGLHRAVQVARVHRVYMYVPEALRERVYLLFAALGDPAVPVPLRAAEEVALRLRVAYEINSSHGSCLRVLRAAGCGPY